MKNLEIEIKHWPIARLSPSPTNPRIHSPEQIAQIARSIEQFGFVNPILVGEDHRIVAGEGRFRAAQALKMREVPVIVLRHLSEVQRRALAIADNQIALNAGWDEQRLRDHLVSLRDEEFDLDLLGFDEQELARHVADPDTAMRTKFRRFPFARSPDPATSGCWPRAKGERTDYCAATRRRVKTLRDC